ncbi:MAG TPA: NADH-quinone oxidoreductase subunit J [Candidatus Dormibacteraeota bacterium]|nr:NADH-quinone oxidoreductase subunit J [Candidatus Dormibacteraeota bacterium]
MNPSVTNPPVATAFFFYLLAATMIIGGILVITRKNAVHSAMALITALLAQAGLYLMLYAPFVAGVQIILYAGGIMVLFLFVIMLISIERTMKERQFNKQWLVGITAAAVLGGLFITVYTTVTRTASGKESTLFPSGNRVAYVDAQNTQGIAMLLFDRGAGTYMFAFEIASLLLLVAIIGAVVMAKKRI